MKKHSDVHLEKSKELYRKAWEEFEGARGRGNKILLRDACGKGWLSAVEASHALFMKKGVEEESLPRTDRERRFIIHKYAAKELKWLYFSLRDNLRIEGYGNGSLNFDEVQIWLDELGLYIRKIEEEE